MLNVERLLCLHFNQTFNYFSGSQMMLRDQTCNVSLYYQHSKNSVYVKNYIFFFQQVPPKVCEPLFYFLLLLFGGKLQSIKPFHLPPPPSLYTNKFRQAVNKSPISVGIRQHIQSVLEEQTARGQIYKVTNSIRTSTFT